MHKSELQLKRSLGFDYKVTSYRILDLLHLPELPSLSRLLLPPSATFNVFTIMSLETCPLYISPVQTIGPQLVPVHIQPRYQSSIEDRPSLKRQATAPLLSRPEKVAKTSKDKIDDSNVPDYSTDIHLAFLEGK